MSSTARFARLRSVVVVSLAVAVTVGLVPTGPAGGLTGPVGPTREMADLDARTGSIGPGAAQLALVARLGAVARWNRFGTPQSLIRYGGFLASGLGADPVAAARTWIGRNRELFRLSQAGVDGLELLNDSPMVGSPGHAVIFRQRFGGLPAAVDGLITVGVTRGRIAYVSSSSAGDGNAPEPATLSATDAWRRAAANAGLGVASSAISGLRREWTWTVFDVAGFGLPQRARLVALPTPRDGVKAAFEANVVKVGGGEALAYTSYVDARSGRVLVRHNQVDHAALTDPDATDTRENPRWKAFGSYPLPDLSARDIRRVGCWTRTARCRIRLKSPATRSPWDFDFTTGRASNTTVGNAATTHENWADPLTPVAGYQPVSATRDYVYSWSDQWNDRKCDPTVFTSLQRNDIDAAVTHLFTAHNRMHDWSYILGFTEENSNLQTSNFGITPASRENDPEIGDAQAGAVVGGFPTYVGRDNANQITLQDGVPGITNQYVFQPIAGAFYSPCVDGDFDNTVVGHEYTHAISTRMVGGPDGGITTFQGGSMGESWSDLAALEYLHELSILPVAGENPWAEGVYVTGNERTGIRNYALDDVPLNFSDIGYDIVGAEVHADAEIWSGVNFDIRTALNQKYDPQFPSSSKRLQRRCAIGLKPVELCPGNRRWTQIMFDAFLLEPSEVGMLDARDAYLAADMMRFGGANQTELWRAFARRGFGELAVSGSEEKDPIPSFESPLAADEATVTFDTVAEDEGDNPVEAEIYVGRYQARVTPTADTVAATSRSDTARFAPGTYEFVVRADGYGEFNFARTLAAGEDLTLTISLASNWASVAQGASTTGDGERRTYLVDDDEGTAWIAKKTLPLPGVDGLQVTVDLGGGKHMVRKVNVSAYITPGGARFAALRKFEVWACNGGLIDPDCLLPTSFQRIFTSPNDAFPGVAPRPLAPDLRMRTFDVPDTLANVVRMVVQTNQCTGGPDYQGEQDNDPLNITDCTLGASDVASQVAAAEFQVFTSDSRVTAS